MAVVALFPMFSMSDSINLDENLSLKFSNFKGTELSKYFNSFPYFSWSSDDMH